jgi:hypothetical protein
MAFLLCWPADASMMFARRDWSFEAPGGSYGFIETEFVTLQGQHTGWETAVACGPLHFTLPCQAPGAVASVAMIPVIAGCLGIVVYSQMKKHALRPTNVP